LKAKYATLAEQQNKQTEEFIATEAEKLDLARSLIDLRLKHSELQEQSEKMKFTNTADSLALKEQLFQLDGQHQLLQV
jgi:hypothetical protein